MRTKWYEHKMYPLSFLFINFVSCCISSFEKKKQYSIHFIFPVILLNEDFWSSFCSGIVFSLDMILLHIKIIFLNAFGFLNYNSTCAFIKSIYIYICLIVYDWFFILTLSETHYGPTTSQFIIPSRTLHHLWFI